jgi:hypothetical protein
LSSIGLRPSTRSSSRKRSSSFFTSEVPTTGSSDPRLQYLPRSRACAIDKAD